MTEEKPIVLLGSSRRNGETERAVHLAFADGVDCLALQDYSFSPYDYQHANRGDDFLKLIDLIVPRNTLVFATPVYWYAMSANMKAFFDRLSDLITIEKQKGRSLAGKTTWLIATGKEEILPDGFEVPFQKTSSYLDMQYRGGCYLYTNADENLRHKTEEELKRFGRRVLGED